MPANSTTEAIADVARKIHVVRGQRVLLDSDLAAVYGVATKRLNEQVRRNKERFPTDFLFVMTPDDIDALRSQIATSKPASPGRGGRRYPPLAFTEHGAVMVATVLNTPRAVDMSVYVVRAFIELRTVLAANTALARKLEALERSVVVLDADSRRQFRELRALVFSLAMPPGKEQ